ILVATMGAAGTKADLSDWFFKASAANQSGTASAKIEPDFLPGKTMNSMKCGGGGIPIGSGIWQLVKYDRAHGIGMAVASTDQCSVSVFKASRPGVSVPDADLSNLSTGRGVRIGTTYKDLIAIYGGKHVARSGRFIVIYDATVPGTSVANPKKKIDNDE